MALRRSEVTNERRKFHELVTVDASEDAMPVAAGLPRLAFGPFVIDPESGRLAEGERVIPLAPKPFETLYYLASHPGRVVPKTELMERLWPGTFVTDDVLVQCVVEIRRALGDQARSSEYVQTVPRRGYEFLAPVQVRQPAARAAGPQPARQARSQSDSQGGASLPAMEPALAAGLPAALFRSRPLPWLILLALLGLAGGWLALRRAVEPPTPPPLEPGSLVVMPILVEEPETKSGWLRHGLAEMIRSQLGQAPGIHVVARHRLAAALSEDSYDEDRGPAPEAAVRIAQRLRAEKLVTGSYVRVGERFVLTATITDVLGGRTEGAASVRGVHPSGVLDAANELCLDLLHDLRPAGGGVWRPTRMPTRSIEAYRHYAEALQAFTRGGRAGAETAEGLLDRALALDPPFALAYVRKAEIQQWRRDWAYGNPDPAPAVLAAARLVKDLPDRERLLVESFEALIVKSDVQAALKDWNALLQFYPTYAQEIGVPVLVANALLRLGRWDDLILAGEAHVDSPSMPEGERARLAWLLAQAYRRKGEFERGLDHARRAVGQWPLREGPQFLSRRVTLGRIALETGRRAEALSEFRAVAAAREADALNLTDAAWGLYMAGEPDGAGRLVARALGVDASYGNAYHLRGWLQALRGAYAEAAASFETAFARTPRFFGSPYQGLVSGDLAAAYYAGVAYRKAGDARRATQAFERLIEHCRRVLGHPNAQPGSAPHWQAASYLARAEARLGRSAPEPPRLEGDDATFFVQSARLHAVQGQHELGLRELAQGLALGFGEYRHIQDDPDFDTLRGRPEFRQLVTERLPHP